MKKIVIFLVILIASIFICNGVSALEYNNEIAELTITNINFRNMSQSEIDTYFDNRTLLYNNYMYLKNYALNDSRVVAGTHDYTIHRYSGIADGWTLVIYNKSAITNYHITASKYNNSYFSKNKYLVSTDVISVYTCFTLNNNINFQEIITNSSEKGDSIVNGTHYYWTLHSSSIGSATTFNIVADTSLNYIFNNYPYNYVITNTNFTLCSKLKIISNDIETIYFENDIINFNSFSFNNNILGLDVGKVEINFEIPNNLSSRDNYDFDLDVSAVSMLANNYSPQPYLVYGSNFDTGTITQLDLFTDYEEFTNESDPTDLRTYTNYSGSFGLDFIYNDSNDYISLIIDFGDYLNYYSLNFTCNLPFSVNYISREIEESYYLDINMYRKYGLYLIPKTLNQDIYTTLYTYGRYDLFFINDYTDDNSDNKYIGAIEENYSGKFSFMNINSALKFTNIGYNIEQDTDLWSINFDTRLFDYVIQETPFDSPNITNSNTGITTNTNDIDKHIADKEKELNDISNIGFFEYIPRIFNHFQNSITEIFKFITNFFLTLPIALQYLIAGIFVLSIFYFIIKFIL